MDECCGGEAQQREPAVLPDVDSGGEDQGGFDADEPTVEVHVSTASVDGDSLLFVVSSSRVFGQVRYSVDRDYDDFEALQHSLFSLEDVKGLSGMLFPPLPPSLSSTPLNSEMRSRKQLVPVLQEDEKSRQCRALEAYLQALLKHPILGTKLAISSFLIQRDAMAHRKMKKGMFSKFHLAVEEMWKEKHKDVDEFFQGEREVNLACLVRGMTMLEKFIDVAVCEHKMAVALNYLSTMLLHNVSPADSPENEHFCRTMVQSSKVMQTVKKGFDIQLKHELNSLGFALEQYVRYQEAEKDMLFRRTCRLIDMENAARALERAKPAKKAMAEAAQVTAEKAFKETTEVARKEVLL
uniref:Si:dkey-28n18.9 n=1 Tax=Eptatretus burgeri TaxID=7764 RepID=A0A8C4R6A2_EPTBU